MRFLKGESEVVFSSKCTTSVKSEGVAAVARSE